MMTTVNPVVVGGSGMNQCLTDFRSYDSMEGIAAIEPSAPRRRFESCRQAKLIHAVYPGLLVAGEAQLCLADSRR